MSYYKQYLKYKQKVLETNTMVGGATGTIYNISDWVQTSVFVNKDDHTSGHIAGTDMNGKRYEIDFLNYTIVNNVYFFAAVSGSIYISTNPITFRQKN